MEPRFINITTQRKGAKRAKGIHMFLNEAIKHSSLSSKAMAKPPAVAPKSCCDGLVGCSPAAHVVVIVIQAALYSASFAALGWGV